MPGPTLDQLDTALWAAGSIVAAVGEGEWSLPTPCAAPAAID